MFISRQNSLRAQGALLLVAGAVVSSSVVSSSVGISEALAQGTADVMSVAGQVAAQGQPPAPSLGEAFSRMLPMLVMVFTIFYFMVIRPQGKKQNQQVEFLRSLKKGDAVVTSGGIHGRIFSIEEGAVHLEIAKDVRIKVDKVALVKPEVVISPDKTNKAA